MCQALRIEDGGGARELNFIVQLMHMIGFEQLIWGHEVHSDPSPHACLCPVDLAATGRSLGYKVDAESWPWGVVWRRAV